MAEREFTGKVSDWDREYMRRIGRYKHESNEETRRIHLAMPGADRLIAARSLRGRFVTVEALERSMSSDNPGAFYERARRLGLIAS